MKTVRYGAAIATIVMSLLNLPVAMPDNHDGIPTALAVLFSVLGVVGIVAAIALLRSAAWATPVVVAVALVNLAGAVIALVANWNGAITGLVLSGVETALAVAYALGKRPARARIAG